MVRKIVISGGPSTGKTSVIDKLKEKFKVMEEAARGVIKEIPIYSDFKYLIDNLKKGKKKKK